MNENWRMLFLIQSFWNLYAFEHLRHTAETELLACNERDFYRNLIFWLKLNENIMCAFLIYVWSVIRTYKTPFIASFDNSFLSSLDAGRIDDSEEKIMKRRPSCFDIFDTFTYKYFLFTFNWKRQFDAIVQEFCKVVEGKRVEKECFLAEMCNYCDLIWCRDTKGRLFCSMRFNLNLFHLKRAKYRPCSKVYPVNKPFFFPKWSSSPLKT